MQEHENWFSVIERASELIIAQGTITAHKKRCNTKVSLTLQVDNAYSTHEKPLLT
jgi:hypothetical protein